MRWNRRLLALAIVVVFPLTSGAEPAKVAVLDFAAGAGVAKDLADPLADLVANAIRALGTHEVIGKSDIRSLLGFEQIKDRIGCDDADCLAEIGGALGVDYIVAGNMARIGATLLLNLRLIDPGRAKVVAGVSRKIEGGDEALLDVVPRAAADLFRGSSVGDADDRDRQAAPAARALRPGTISIRLSPEVDGAVVFVDDEEVGAPPWKGEVAPGEHRIVVKAPGRRTETLQTRVNPGRQRVLEISLIKEGELNTGLVAIGLVLDLGVGSIYLDGVRDGYFSITPRPKLSVGFQILKEPVWWELGISGGPGVTKFDIPARYSGNNFGFLSALTRVMLPIYAPWIYVGAELEVGAIFVQDPAGALVALRAAVSFFVSDWVELRLNPAGFSYLGGDEVWYWDDTRTQQTTGSHYLYFAPSFGIVLRL